MTAPTKIPLLTRKSIKDDFDAKKEDLAKKWKDVLGQDYRFEVDFPALYANAEGEYQQGSIGKVVYEAIEDGSKRVAGGDKLLIDGFNEVVSKHIITVVMDPEFKGSYCGCRVKDGVFEIVFKPKGLGTNSYSACEYWQKAISEASAQANPKGLPPTAKSGIKNKFEDQLPELEEKISKLLGGEKFTCHVDFEDMWGKIIDAHEALPENKKRDLDLDHLARQLGNFTFNYFESLRYWLEQELKGDELMIEGLLDEVSTKQAWFGLVAESEPLKKSYSDTLIEDGKLWCKTKPTKFGVNVNNGFEGFSKLL